MQCNHPITQYTLNFTMHAGPALPLCPADLLPDAVVALDDPLLLISDLDIRERMRARVCLKSQPASISRCRPV